MHVQLFSVLFSLFPCKHLRILDACTTNSPQFSPKSNYDSKLAFWGFQTSNAVTRRPTSNFVSNNVPNFISEKCFEGTYSECIKHNWSWYFALHWYHYLLSVIQIRDRLFAIQIRDYLCVIDVLSYDSWKQCCFYHIYR